MITTAMRLASLPVATFFAIPLFATPLPATTWHVPSHCPTIQAGIDSASVGDSVLVAAGTYFENITMKSDVCLLSESGPTFTVIDGQRQASVVTCHAVANVTIAGFTIQNGQGSGGNTGTHGGGLDLTDCGPTLMIENNVVCDNYAWDGGGVIVWRGEGPTIEGNVFMSNHAVAQSASSYGLGGAIFMSNMTATIPRPGIRDNSFVGNYSDRGGSAITSFQYCEPSIEDNVFWANIDSGMCPMTSGTIFLNAITPILRGNTLVGNSGGAVIAISDVASPEIANSVLALNEVDEAIRCMSGASPSFCCCDIYGNSGGDWTSCSASFLGVDGNFSADPLFCDPDNGDFTVASNSPCLPGHHPAGYACGLIGALEQGCGAVSHTLETWANIKSHYR